MQLPSQVRDSIECFEPLNRPGTRYRIHEGTGVVIDIATLFEITALAGFPEGFTGYATQQTIKDGTIFLILVGNDSTQIKINHSYGARGRQAVQTILYQS